MGYIDELGKNAKVASQSLVKLGTAEKNQILGQVADALLAETDYILA
ncbi:gamma-glutamyl-phosphate reductase, partial [Enterococcus faecalis]